MVAKKPRENQLTQVQLKITVKMEVYFSLDYVHSRNPTPEIKEAHL